MEKESIFNYTIQDLQDILIENGFKKFAAQQVFDWLYVKLETDFNNMTNLSKKLKEFLLDKFNTLLLSDLTVKESKDGTIKILFMLDDKKTIETVLMPQKYGQSVCVTTQVGCKMACTFCASGLIKTERNLTVGEIVRQVFFMNKLLKEKFKNDLNNPKARISHIVIMGIGEPMDNFDNVIKFIKIVNDPLGFSIGARHITVSTCGIVPKIKQFADLNIQVNLAISLHAPNDELRNQLMPINKVFNIEKLIDSIKYYIGVTNRRVTFEYILIEGTNDLPEHAEQLARLIRGINSYVNLIPYNEVEENPFKKSLKINQFFKILKGLGINAIVRKEFGSDINAACGQLRAKREGAIKNDF